MAINFEQTVLIGDNKKAQIKLDEVRQNIIFASSSDVTLNFSDFFKPIINKDSYIKNSSHLLFNQLKVAEQIWGKL